MMQSALFELIQCPNITNEPINEFHAPDGLATQSFSPHLVLVILLVLIAAVQ